MVTQKDSPGTHSPPIAFLLLASVLGAGHTMHPSCRYHGSDSVCGARARSCAVAARAARGRRLCQWPPQSVRRGPHEEGRCDEGLRQVATADAEIRKKNGCDWKLREVAPAGGAAGARKRYRERARNSERRRKKVADGLGEGSW